MRHSVVMLAVVGLFVPPQRAHADGVVSGGTRPVVLVISVGNSPEALQRERRFVTNLALNIDGFNIKMVEPPIREFAQSSLDKQIEPLKPLMKGSGAVAAMWLSAVSKDVLLLQVVVLDTGRALVRLFEGELKEGSEEKLAFTASELLGTAYMFDPPSREKAPEIHQLVVEAREQAGVKQAADSPWRMYINGVGKVGVIGKEGPQVSAGGPCQRLHEHLGLDWVLVLLILYTLEVKLEYSELSARL